MYQRILILGFLSIFALLSISVVPQTGALMINVGTIEKMEGIIWVGIYDSEDNFLIKEKAIVEGFQVNPDGSQDHYLRCSFPQLRYGTYAIALFHDINSNGELDTNFIGIPTEPYGFSGMVHSKWRLPRFQEVQFNFNQSELSLEIELKEW